MRVAFFGGSFNPPHVAHQMVALYVLETSGVDELWFVPCFRHPFDKALVPFEHRLRMCELASQSLGTRARVSDVERVMGGESKTLLTIKALRARHPEHEFSLVIGADIEPELPLWYGAEELIATVPRIVVGRGGYNLDSAVTMPTISSTDIRRRLSAGEATSCYLSRRVECYIHEHSLYQGSS